VSVPVEFRQLLTQGYGLPPDSQKLLAGAAEEIRGLSSDDTGRMASGLRSE
jgi:hypothetical protein